MFDRLFEPLEIGHTILPNRICFLSHRTNFAEKGRLTERLIAYYRRRAQGGCGLIIMGEISIHPADRPYESMVEAYHPKSAEDFKKLTAAVHEFETPIFAQLRHGGFQSSGAITRKAVWGPSAVSDIVFGETAKPLEGEEMEELAESFSRAAGTVQEGGFDGLEIDMGPESLLRQFLSPISNHRRDEYGGSLENRMRFPLRVIEGVRKRVGHDFTLGVRLCVDEKFWGGITPEESREMAKGLEATGGVDFINTSVGTYYNLHLSMASMHIPSGFTVEAAEQIKKNVTLPVIASHQIDTPQQANEILEHGRADAVGLIRNLICDPDAPKKAREGRAEDIRSCVRENEGCIGRTNQSKTLSCIQNPDVGYESLSGEAGLGRGSHGKRVMIVGGGPAGLEAALVAAERGHDVTLYEREERIGGQINLAKIGPGRQGLGEIIRYQAHMLKKSHVRVVTGVEVTPDMVLENRPDVVIVATGSKPTAKPVPGDYGPPAVLHVRDVLASRFPVGQKVLFIDENGGHRATGTVELLAEQGKKVDLVTSALFVGMRLAPIGDLYLSRQRLLQKGVTFTTDTVVDEIDGRRVKAHGVFTNRPLIFEGYETIVLDMGDAADEALYLQLKGRVKELYRAGDCVAPRGIDMAILEGKRLGEKL